jgi:hypothetical protein
VKEGKETRGRTFFCILASQLRDSVTSNEYEISGPHGGYYDDSLSGI